MKTSTKVICCCLAVFTLFLIVVASIGPATSPKLGTVSGESSIKYSIGEKVKANPYGDWLDGEVVAVTSEDEYIVKYCSPIGYFHHWECKQDSLERSQLAKVLDINR